MKPIIHSQKHYVQQSRSTVVTVSKLTIDLVLAVKTADVDLVDEVEEGALVKAVFVELWLLDSANDGSFIVCLEKKVGGIANMSFGQQNALGTYKNKKNILYTTQGLTPNNGVGNPVPIIRQWFKIPKGKQRFGLGDELVLNICNNGGNDMFFCGFSTYKELD